MPPFAAAVRGSADRTRRRDRRQAHHRTVTLLEHDRQRRLRAHEHALEVDLEDAVPRLLGAIPRVDRLALRDARVVHEDVDRPEPFDGAVDDGARAVHRRDVADHELGFAAGALHDRARLLRAGAVDIGDDDLRALFAEPRRGHPSEAGARTRDDRNLVAQPHPAPFRVTDRTPTGSHRTARRRGTVLA